MKHKHNAMCGENFCFHGAFREKAKAVEKERSTPGAFVRRLNYPPYSIRDQRYAVLTRKNPSHIRLDRGGLRRFNQAREWMQENAWNYFAPQPLAQDAARKYGVPTADLMEEAKKIKAQKNPLFTRRQKRKFRQKVRHGVRQGIMGLFGMKKKPVRFASGRPASPPKSAPQSSVLRDEVIEAVRDQYKISRKKAAAMVPAAEGGDTFESLFRRVMAKARRNPDLSRAAVRARLSPQEQQHFDRASDFFREWHGTEPRKVIRKQATIIEAGDYTMLGKLFGYDMEGWDRHPFNDTKPNVTVKASNGIMLCGASLEEVDGKLVAHQALIIGGDQNLEPVLDSQFGVTSSADLVMLGRIRVVWYLAKKKQNGYKLTAWHHSFGEEENTPADKRAARPFLMYDRIHQKQFLVGGEYSIPVEGIRN